MPSDGSMFRRVPMEKKILLAFTLMVVLLIMLATVSFMTMNSYRAQAAREHLSLLSKINKWAPLEKSGEIALIKSQFLTEFEQASKRIHTVMTVVTAVSVFLAILITVFVLRFKQNERLKVASAAGEGGRTEAGGDRVASSALRPLTTPKNKTGFGLFGGLSTKPRLGLTVFVMALPILIMAGLCYFALSATEHETIEITRSLEGNAEKPVEGESLVYIENALESLEKNINNIKTTKQIIIIAAIICVILCIQVAFQLIKSVRKELIKRGLCP